MWYYTCCCSGEQYLNRLLDKELLRARYLHWGLNHYECTDDSFKGHAGSIETLSTTALPCGDSHIVYPLGKQVLRSVRFEMMRAGCEDYELLAVLSVRDPQKGTALLSQCISSFTEYCTDVTVFEQVYGEMLRCLAEGEK